MWYMQENGVYSIELLKQKNEIRKYHLIPNVVNPSDRKHINYQLYLLYIIHKMRLFL